MKNCDPLVLGPEFAIDNKPGWVCEKWKDSSGKLPVGYCGKMEAGSLDVLGSWPDWIMKFLICWGRGGVSRRMDG